MSNFYPTLSLWIHVSCTDTLQYPFSVAELISNINILTEFQNNISAPPHVPHLATASEE